MTSVLTVSFAIVNPLNQRALSGATPTTAKFVIDNATSEGVAESFGGLCRRLDWFA